MNNINFTFLLNLCFLFSLFYSCKKEEANTTIPMGGVSFNCLPDLIKAENDSIVTKYFFDNQKRIYRIEDYLYGMFYRTTYYTYNFSVITVKDTSSNGVFIRKYGLNTQGYPKYCELLSSDPDFFDTTFYFYDTDNHIIQENDTSWDSGSIFSYTLTTHQVVNENRIYSLISYFNAAGNLYRSDTCYFEYYPYKQNIFDFDFGLNGKKNANLLKNRYRSYDAAQYSANFEFNYDLDNYGYIIRRGERVKSYQGGVLGFSDTSNVTITYKCN